MRHHPSETSGYPPLVLSSPLTPAGKNPPDVTGAGFRYTILSTWPGEREYAIPLASNGTRLAAPSRVIP